MRFVSTRGESPAVDLEMAVRQGFAPDGGFYVPEAIPSISDDMLEAWSSLGFVDLAFEILSLFIDEETIPREDLRRMISSSFASFTHPDVVPLVPLASRPNTYIMELFHGPTLSFKDVAMGVLINALNYFLERKRSKVSLVVATTGDTGPAAAWATQGKAAIDCWVLYPDGMISEEQARQMTTLKVPNVHAVAVADCPNGGDDLDVVVAEMFADPHLKKNLQLSSVNSINWCRVMVQAVHYFYGYFRVVQNVGDAIAFAVPSGAFGNMFGGYLARTMGLPVKTFVCATNDNATLHRVFDNGRLSKADLKQTVSSAIDIVIPYNFWRYLYFAAGCDAGKIRNWMSAFREKGVIQLGPDMLKEIRSGFQSAAISDALTLATIKELYHSEDAYLLDPHGAVAVAAASRLASELGVDTKVVCLATAHPAKFPDVIRQALGFDGSLPEQAVHRSIEEAKAMTPRYRLLACDSLGADLRREMTQVVAKWSDPQ